MEKTRQPLILTALCHEAAAIRKAVGDSARVEVIGPRGAIFSKVDLRDVDRVILAGLAGSLSSNFRTGDVVIDELSTWDAPKLPGQRGKFHIADRIIETPDQKFELFRTTGAVLVDMESDAVRSFAAARQIPYLGIRAVLDQADETLDPRLLTLTDTRGRIRPISLAIRLPFLLPTLLRMRSKSTVAMRSLCDAIRRTLDEKA